MTHAKQGHLIVISGPSGVGKTTLYQKILPIFKDRLEFSISATTRAPRLGEEDKKDYYFLDQGEFRNKIEKGEFIEWAKVHGNYYGTLKSEIDRILTLGKSCLLDIDVQGGMGIRKILPKSKLIFMLPPSLSILTERLTQRNTDAKEVLALRIQNAEEELKFASQYDYQIINDNLETAIKELSAVLEKLI